MLTGYIDRNICIYTLFYKTEIRFCEMAIALLRMYIYVCVGLGSV